MHDRRRSWWGVACLLLAMALVAAGCGSEQASTGGGPGKPDRVRMQLSWIPDAQFAGYLMARDQGFYRQENLDVELLPGGPNVNAIQQVVSGAADFTVNKVSALLAARDKRLPVISVAQFDQTSSFPLVAFKSTGINAPQDFRGKKVGIWFDGDELEFMALMSKVGLNPRKDLNLFEQGFTMDSFLAHEYDVAMVTTFNELNVIYLHGVEPADLTVINPSDYGISIPHGALIANQQWLGEANHKDVAARFVRATMKGWDYAFANKDRTAEVTRDSALKAGGESAAKDLLQLQKMALDAMEKLHYPSGFDRADHGRIDPALYQGVADIVKTYGLVKQPVDVNASFDASVWQAAAGKG